MGEKHGVEPATVKDFMEIVFSVRRNKSLGMGYVFRVPALLPSMKTTKHENTIFTSRRNADRCLRQCATNKQDHRPMQDGRCL